MKSDIVKIDNAGHGFSDVKEVTSKVAEYLALSHGDSLKLQLMAEEVLSLARSITGEMKADFWLESDGDWVELHLTTRTVMDKEKRALLISSSSSRKNEAARSFIGKLRDAFEQAMASEVDHQYYDLPSDIISDLPESQMDDPEWDGYERSILRKLADDIKVGVRGKLVYVVVGKRFEK